MPYITTVERKKFEPSLYSLTLDLNKGGFNEGELNYVISKLCKAAWDKNPRYVTANKIIGVLECAKQEFYRKQIGIYEDLKETENGRI